MALASIDISTTPASTHIPCGLQAGLPEEAHGICALAVLTFYFLDDRQTAHRFNLFHADHRAQGGDTRYLHQAIGQKLRQTF